MPERFVYRGRWLQYNPSFGRRGERDASMEAIPSASYSFTLRVEFPHRAGSLGKILTTVGEAGAMVGAVDIVRMGQHRSTRDITVNARDSGHGQQVVKAVDDLPEVKVINVSDRTFLVHLGGKIEVRSRMQIRTRDDLSMVYTPGVARVCRAIADDPERAFNLTVKRNTVAVVSDGTAVLGLGDIGPRAAMPVFHDDQHGTAVVVLAALINSLKIVEKRIEDLRVVISGVGASGVACAKIMMAAGARNIVGCDSRGVVHKDREGLNPSKQWFAEHTNPESRTGTLSEAVAGADLFLGLSAPDVLTVEDLKKMGEDPIIFAMANPDPEIRPEVALGHARIIATGRSDYPNQINNVLRFPGIFRGALDVRAREINEDMKPAAAEEMAGVIPEKELSEDYITPSVFDERAAPAVAEAVAETAEKTGMARRVQERTETGLSTTAF